MEPLEPINTNDVLENDRRFQYFGSGYYLGYSDAMKTLKKDIQNACSARIQAMELPDSAESVYENLCKLEVLDRKEKDES